MKEQVKTLGIHLAHDATVTLLDFEGKIESTLSEERKNRIKAFCGWPKQALKTFKSGKYHIAIAGRRDTWEACQQRWVEYLFNGTEGYFDIFNEYSLRYALSPRGKRDVEPVILDRLKDVGIEPITISYQDHHLCHAASAYYSSGFENALVVTADGMGDGLSGTIYEVRSGKWRKLTEIQQPISVGHMYSWITRYAGFKVSRHEGKITGLAAFGNPQKLPNLKGKLACFDDKLLLHRTPFMEEFLVNGGLITSLKALMRNQAVHEGYLSFNRMLNKYYPKELKIEDLAALGQLELEDAIVSWIKYYLGQSGLKHVALAGGVFANVKLNQCVAEIPDVEGMWVFPAMGDAGVSAGAAFLDYASRSKTSLQAYQLPDVYLGPSFSDKEIDSAISEFGLFSAKPNNIEELIADLIAKRKLVGLFQGRMEYGPRSLGHRSILIHPGDRSINTTINQRLKRTEFMPFAPVCLKEHADDLFYNWTNSRKASEFMTITYDVKAKWTKPLEAVVHVDGTARPQVISEGIDERYWKILRAFYRKTGLPACVNTSFNMHEEPIVCSPREALRSYLSGSVDVLILGDCIVAKTEVELKEITRKNA